jgi:outer membrane protein OmpA-like peptidoglycan-associated protein
MRISLLTALSVALVSAGITCAQADQTYYNPANPASSTGFTNGYELFRTIGCPGKALFDKACDVPVPVAVATPAPAPAPAPVAAPAPEPVAAAPMDSDHDGVVDSMDKCPNTPAGRTVDAQGCELDGDHDGVVDALDKCPDTPAGDRVDEYGCTIKNVIILKGVNFDFDSAKLRPESYATLDHAVATLKQNNFPTTELAAYTDSVGKDAYNLKLSQRRAKTVKDYMVSKGCPASSLTTKGFGEADPVADNKTKAGRFENRRVEMHLQ